MSVGGSLLPPVVLEIKGNISQLKGKLGEVAADVEKSSGKSATHLQKLGKAAGPAMLAVGAGLTAVGGLLTNLGEPLEAAQAQFKVAFANSGQSVKALGEPMGKITNQMAGFGHSSADTTSALAKLITAGVPASQAVKDLGIAADLAARQHTSLSTATDMVVKVIGGKGARVLTQFGIVMGTNTATAAKLTTEQSKVASTSVTLQKAQQKLTDLMAADAGKTKLTAAQQIALRNAHMAVAVATTNHADAEFGLAVVQGQMTNGSIAGRQALDQLAGKLKGSASAAANTFGGKIDGVKTKVENIAASFGAKFGPALTAVGPIMMTMGMIMDSSLLPAIISVGAAIIPVVASVLLAAAPFIVLGAALWAAYKYFPPFRDAVNFLWQALQTLVNFIVQHWKAALQIVLLALGPLGLAIDLVVFHFNDLKKVALDVWNVIVGVIKAAWSVIQTVFSAIVTFVTDTIPSAFKSFLAFVSSVWSGITGAISAAWNAIKSVFTTIVKAIKDTVEMEFNILKTIVMGVWTAITGAITNAWSTISGIFTAIVNRLKNGLEFEFNAVKGIASAVWSAVTGFITGAWSTISGIFDKIVSTLKSGVEAEFRGLQNIGSTVWSALQSIIQSAWNIIQIPLDALKSAINDIVNGFNDIVGAASKVGGAVSGALSHVPGGSLLKHIGLASGTSYSAAGLTLVGEQGPELVNMPGGSQVYNARQTAGMMGGGSQGMTFAPVYNIAAGASADTLRQVLAQHDAQLIQQLRAFRGQQ